MSTFIYFKSIIRFVKTVNRFCSKRSISSNKGNDDRYLQMYTSDQQVQILDTLHKCASNNIPRLHLNQKRLQSLRVLFEQNPNLQSLEPLLKVKGLGPRVLNRICKSIIDQEMEEIVTSDKNINSNGDSLDNQNLKLASNLITPGYISKNDINTVVGIHLGINAISWARLHTASDSKLDTWSVMDLSDHVDKKYDAHSVWKLVTDLRNEIPNGDIYVMENSNWSNVASIKKPMKYHIQEAMLTTAICTVFNLTDFKSELRLETGNRIYFLRMYTPSRLFRKIVGSERVSAQDTVQNMIDGVPDERHQPITFTANIADNYRTLSGSLRDNMCQALLLVVSFNELILRFNLAARSTIGKSITKKKNNGS